MEDFARQCNPCPWWLDPKEDDLSIWFSYWILHKHLPLYGVRAPSHVIRRVMEKVHLRKGGTEGWVVAGGRVECTELFVRRIDLWKSRHAINPAASPIHALPYFGPPSAKTPATTKIFRLAQSIQIARLFAWPEPKPTKRGHPHHRFITRGLTALATVR